MGKHFGWNHPLRRAWRKSGGDDNLRVMVGVTAASLLVAGLFQLVAWLNPGKVEGITPHQFGMLGVGLALVLWGGFALITYFDPDESFFPAALRRAEELLGFDIYPDYPTYILRGCAWVKLEGLAYDLSETEKAIRDFPHNGNLYDARAQARRKFARMHKFFLNLGLAEEKWDPYFKNNK